MPQRDEISGDMRQRFEMLVPHFLRAATIQQRLHKLEAAVLQNAQATCEGVILLDHKARPVWLDDGACDVIIGSPFVRLEGAALHLATPEATQALDASIRACVNPARARHPARLAVECGSPDDPLTIEPLPMKGMTQGAPLSGARVALVLRMPRLRRERVARRLMAEFGLTQAESRVAIEISRGDGREAAAARMQISVNTVRTHLVSIFDKMGVKRQAELIRIVMSR